MFLIHPTRSGDMRLEENPSWPSLLILQLRKLSPEQVRWWPKCYELAKGLGSKRRLWSHLVTCSLLHQWYSSSCSRRIEGETNRDRKEEVMWNPPSGSDPCLGHTCNDFLVDVSMLHFGGTATRPPQRDGLLACLN